MLTGDSIGEIKSNLTSISEIEWVADVKVENNMIALIALNTTTVGNVNIQRLNIQDAGRLFDFYTDDLSEKSKHLFAPYPLFHTPPQSAAELKKRMVQWENEKDWTANIMIKDGRIIGFSLLKRFHSEELATSAIAVSERYMQKKVGLILQSVIVEQARLLNLKKFHVKIVSDNTASIRLHEKCGFRKTRILSPPLYEEILKYLSDCDVQNGKESANRHIVEMVMDLQ